MIDDKETNENENENEQAVDEFDMEQELRRQQLLDRRKAAKQTGKNSVKEAGKEMTEKIVKKGVKKLISSAFVSVVLPILASPVFWITLGAIFLIVFLIYIITHPCEALDFIDLGFLKGLCENIVPGA